MFFRLPFFGLVAMRSPLNGLLEHYERTAEGLALVKKSMQCLLGEYRQKQEDFLALLEQLDEVEDLADAIKRKLRNHLPRGIFLPVDKHIFFLYTRAQDDILDYGQHSLHWLALRELPAPEEFRRELLLFLDQTTKTAELLRPALEATVSWVNAENITREEAKQYYLSVRGQHKTVSRARRAVLRRIYSSNMDFRDIYQLIHVLDQLYNMSHSAEGCADLLRVMIAK
ncbi:MAG: DUF47 family protein [Desulfovibrio sp.]|jgi:predicted phosphate transport protein (TIGR00153 family)|nr:DUF47 family protein [Desulfovibrio sp.]